METKELIATVKKAKKLKAQIGQLKERLEALESEIKAEMSANGVEVKPIPIKAKQPPLQHELQDTQERLTRLREAEQRELDGDSKDRIKRAIKAHEAKIADLETLIQRKRSFLYAKYI